MFDADVAKVDRDIAYVASVSQACCKHLFKMFHLFQTYVASVSIWMLYMFHTYMSQEYVRNVSTVSALYCKKCFHVVRCKCFIWMLHMFRTYVSSVCSKYFICFRVYCIQVFHILEVESHGAWPGRWGMGRS
jgi:hypothetical protein